jgi:glutamate N-acetyltransferase/amino-acid N-acetyltransferase
MITDIPGGVCAPAGFSAAGVHAGLRKNAERSDLALIFAERECAAAAVYTTNLVRAAPVELTREHLTGGAARAMLVNSGNANACAPGAMQAAERSCAAAAAALGIDERLVIVASTGVIGKRLPAEKIEAAAPGLASALRADKAGSRAAAEAIMTTDTRCKQAAASVAIGGQTVSVGAIAKGSGMIRPNMATMLALLTTDCAIAAPMLQKALRASAGRSYNRVSVDGDTSTNDMCAVMASGLAGNPLIEDDCEDYRLFLAALNRVNLRLAKDIARDGEGATKLLICRVSGAASRRDADTLSMAVVSSSLVKAAMFGADANWGRVICALGYSGAALDPARVAISFSGLPVCEGGAALDFCEETAKELLLRDEILIDVKAGDGPGFSEAYGCDLTYEYVKINGDYRT